MLHRAVRISLLSLLAFLVACGGAEEAAPTSTAAPEEVATEAVSTAAPPETEPTVPVSTAAPPETEPTVPVSTAAPPESNAPDSNLTDGCVESYDPAVDYFPEKADLTYATNFSVEYFLNYKIITIDQPYPGAAAPLQYVLVQCGTPAPDVDGAATIEVPSMRFISTSTTNLPYLVELDLLDRLVAVDSFGFVTSPAVRALIDAGELSEVAAGGQINTEAVLAAEPDLVMTFGTGSPEFDAAPQLLELDVPAVYNADFLETDPLGRTEWVKFVAAFNAEADAELWFSEVAAEYETLRNVAAEAEEQPAVFLNTPFEGTWYLPGGEGYQARLLADAGAEYVGADLEGTASAAFDLEAVLERAGAADYWINVGFYGSLADLVAADERFAEFAAFQENNVYNYDNIVGANGGFDYFESGSANPHVVLADLIAIFHPELLPDHELVYYRQLPEG